MRITKRQLRRIIREAMGQHKYRPWFRKPPKLPKDEWKIGDKVVANGYPGVIEDVGDDGMVEVRLKRGVVAVDGSTIVRQHEAHIRESLFLERGEVNVSQIKKYEPEIREWVETLIDAMGDRVSAKVKEIDDKTRKRIVDGVTHATVLELIDQFGYVTGIQQQQFARKDFEKQYDLEKRRRHSGI